ncbi:MAG: hypothetical protein ACXAAH_05650, partial [Promethearchaeota archaeon]
FGLVYIDAVGGLVATQGANLAALGVNISMTLLPGIACLIGLIIWVKFYPLNGKVVKTMKKEVQALHEQKRREHKEKKRVNQ